MAGVINVAGEHGALTIDVDDGYIVADELLALTFFT